MAQSGPPPLEPSQPGSKKGTNGKYLFQATDPQGFEISLDVETWENHIMPRHPEVEKFFDLLARVISDPQLIRRSSNQGETYYYYRLTGRSFARAQDIYLSIVVRRDEEAKTGVVKTAHLLKEVHREANTVWMKRN